MPGVETQSSLGSGPDLESGNATDSTPLNPNRPGMKRQESFVAPRRVQRQTSAHFVYADREDNLPIDVTVAFLRKVYGILTAQLMLTVGLSCLFMYHIPTRSWMLSAMGMHSTVIIWTQLLVSIAIILLIYVFKNIYPWNYLLLFSFTLVQSVVIACVCAMFEKSGNGDLVLQAAILTLIGFCGLSAYTLRSRTDFSFMGAYLSSCLWVLIGWSICGWVFGFTPSLIYNAFGVLVFMGYIVYDTHMIKTRLGVDDFIIAALELYLDIINLFLHILQLLAKSRG